jgi:hypothetical protein
VGYEIRGEVKREGGVIVEMRSVARFKKTNREQRWRRRHDRMID